MRKDIVEILNIKENLFNTFKEDNCIHEYILTIVEEHRKKRDELYYQSLYEVAKEKGITTLFVIDLPQFKKFINDCLPEWLKGQKSQQVLEILRKNLDLEIIDVCKTYGIYKVHIANLHQELTIDENEFKLVKEWIENGKKGI